MSVNQAFQLITRTATIALRRPDLGTIQVSAKADLVGFRTDSPNRIEVPDPVAAIILHSEVGNIEDMLIDGKFVKRSGSIVQPDNQRTSAVFVKFAKRIQEIWAQTDWQPLEDLHFGDSAPNTTIADIDLKSGPGTAY